MKSITNIFKNNIFGQNHELVSDKTNNNNQLYILKNQTFIK